MNLAATEILSSSLYIFVFSLFFPCVLSPLFHFALFIKVSPSLLKFFLKWRKILLRSPCPRDLHDRRLIISVCLILMQGLYRQIFVDTSASLQLQGFYDEVATPLLHNIDIQYADNAIDVNSVTQTSFISYFKGTELVVAGKLNNDIETLSASVLASSRLDNELEMTVSTSTMVSHFSCYHTEFSRVLSLGNFCHLRVSRIPNSICTHYIVLKTCAYKILLNVKHCEKPTDT